MESFSKGSEQVLNENLPEPYNDPNQRPSLKQLELNASLTLIYGHPLLMDGLRPTSPNNVFVGMMNCRPANYSNVPPDILQFIQESPKEGVIYVAFGTLMQTSQMPEEVRVNFLKAFGKLKQRVLMKWETGSMSGEIPSNIKLAKWFPQQDILGHPKVKLFVTHGGQSSFQEMLCHQKPGVFIPKMCDQHGNSNEGVNQGLGIQVNYESMTPEILYEAIMEVLNNSKYSSRAQELGSLLLDEINQPLERAIWWIEYVIRHPKTSHFKPHSHRLTWIQFHLIDIYAFLALTCGVIVYIVKIILGYCCCCSKAKKSKYE